MSFFRSFTSGMNRNALSHSQKVDLIRHLHTKSDIELNALSLNRRNISAMVMQGAITHKY